jgi:hypothetical protein
VENGVSPAATRYAAVEEFWAASEDASAAPVVPDTNPGGKPVMEVPGESPILPVITDDPVLVIVEPAITAYGVAAPRLIGVTAAMALPLAKALSVTRLTRPEAMAPRVNRTLER